MQSTVYFSLGSNIGDRYLNLSNCISLIEKNIGDIKSISSIYKNSAQGFIGDYFYNCCIEVSTLHEPLELIDKIKFIELEMGRKKRNSEEYESRKIDIDIILYDNLIINETNLTIPHPRYTERNFVLLPLAEINDQLADPISKININELSLKIKSEEILEKIKFHYSKV
tara:strand:- start:2416 stop:2922 length:507 start_codon:yes stop_codon:yes gene_type:complete